MLGAFDRGLARQVLMETRFEVQFDAEDFAALTIQRFYRGHAARRHYKLLLLKSASEEEKVLSNVAERGIELLLVEREIEKMQQDILERHRLFAYQVKKRVDAAIVIQRFFRQKRAIKSPKNSKVRLSARSIENFKKSRHRKPLILDETVTSLTLKTSVLDKTAPLKDALAWSKGILKQ